MTPVDTAPSPSHRHRRTYFALALLVLVMIGIALLHYRSQYALIYWMSMVPVFGGVNAAGSWSHLRESGAPANRLARRLVLHWGGLALVLGLMFLVMDEAQIRGEVAGMIAALLLALTCFEAGVHFDWHFMVLGGALALAVAGGAVAEQYFWFALIVVIIALVLFIAKVRRGESAE